MDLTQKTASGKVCININPETDSYSLVCNYCETGVRFSSFEEFLGHAREVHGPGLGVSSMNIVPEVSRSISNHSLMYVNTTKDLDSEQGIPTTSCNEIKSQLSSSTTFSTMVHPSLSPLTLMSTSTLTTTETLTTPVTNPLMMMLTPMKTQSKSHRMPFDLRLLKRPCLLELIQLLNKCLCIWHKPTRHYTTSRDRFRAYQLLLIKLREHHPAATFRNVRSIMRQLIMKFYHQQKQANDAKLNGLPKIKKEQLDNDPYENHVCEQDPTSSSTVLDQLKFLNHTDATDTTELNIDKLCSFCDMFFYTTEALWTHMVSAHLPDKRKDKQTTSLVSLRSAMHQRSRDTCVAVATAASTSSAAARSAAAHPSSSPISSARKRSQSRDWRTADETDYYTDCSDSEWERRSAIRHSRRQKQCGWRYEKFGGAPHAKRIRNKQPASESTSNADTDSSHADSKPSTFYLSDYSDAFLEDFIDLYRQQECLWQENSTTYKQRKLKAAAYEVLTAKCLQSLTFNNSKDNTSAMNVSKVKRLIRRIRGYYERLNRPHANPYRSHIWQRMAFIETGRRVQRRNAGGAADSSCSIGGGGDGPLRCNKCARRFKRDKYYLDHKLKEHPPTECPACQENFGNADNLRRHLLLYHCNAEACPLCRNAHLDWKSPRHLAQHFYDHTCPLCAKVFHDTINFQRHKCKCYSRDRFKCDRCGAIFRGSTNFRRHAQMQHQDEHPFKCKQCEEAFKYLTPLTKHRRMHQHQQTQPQPQPASQSQQKCT